MRHDVGVNYKLAPLLTSVEFALV